MEFLHHVVCCNRFERQRFRPLLLDGRRVGFVRGDNVPWFADRTGLFAVDPAGVSFAPAAPRGAALTEALATFCGALAADGLIAPLRGERFAVTDRAGGRVLFELDRGAIPFFGTRSYGVHVNGLVGDRVWVGTRSPDKKVAPGKLDNLIAGGMSAGYGPLETVIKEAAEEAGLPASLAGQARPVGAILYRMEVEQGVRDDVLYLYDLELPPSFEPVPVDGECAGFGLHPVDEVLRRVAETDDFKFNVNLVLIDLAIRRGLIGPDDPDYLALVAGLRGGLIREAG
jgi:8-oxo-dGTP pyrophosphatase MutT (NUDIX family)